MYTKECLQQIFEIPNNLYAKPVRAHQNHRPQIRIRRATIYDGKVKDIILNTCILKNGNKNHSKFSESIDLIYGHELDINNTTDFMNSSSY